MAAYRPMTLAELGTWLVDQDDQGRWHMIAEFLEEHRRSLEQFWFPYNTPAARAEAIVHAPAAFRRRGVFVARYELDVA